jgi:antitoxin VapB
MSSWEDGMPLNVKDERAHRAARELARLKGKSITEVVTDAVEEALTKERAKAAADDLVAALDEIAQHCASLPLLDRRSTDEILGYGDHGEPGGS